MLKMIRQFTFHHPKQIIAPTLWLFLSQAFSILPAILAYMASYLLGQACYPPVQVILPMWSTPCASGCLIPSV